MPFKKMPILLPPRFSAEARDFAVGHDRGRRRSGTRASDRSGRGRSHQVDQPHQVVRGKRQQRLPREFLQALVPSLAQAADRLDPAERFFHHLAPPQARGVFLTPGRAAIHGGAHVLASNMCLQASALEKVDELLRVISLVGTNAGAFSADTASDQELGRLPLGASVGQGGLYVHDQAMPVLREHVGHVSQLGLGEFALLVEPGLRVGRALMRRVTPRLALEIHRGIAPRRCGRAAAVLGLKALVAGPGLDHRAIHTEMLVAHEALPFSQVQHPLEEFAGQLRAQQAIPVDAEDRPVPDRRVHLQPDEPTEHQVVVRIPVTVTADSGDRDRWSCKWELLPIPAS